MSHEIGHWCNAEIPHDQSFHHFYAQWKPGTPGAMAKLEGFLNGKISVFDHERCKVDRESTSQLSPWIHSGSISIRYIFHRVREVVVTRFSAALTHFCVINLPGKAV